jgi:hypothetical protein
MRPAAARAALLALAMTLLAGAHGAVLVLRPPWIHELEGWFWRFEEKPLAHRALLALPAALASAILLSGSGRRRSRGCTLVLVAALAFANQIVFALMEGRGLQALQDRMITTGHAAFAEAALRREGLIETARGYEGIAEDFLDTKPPGTLLVYMATKEASRLLDAAGPGLAPRDRLTIFASLAWPLMACGVLLLLPPLGRGLGARAAGLHGAALAAAAPNVALITLHLDQCLYPALAAACLLALIRAHDASSGPAALTAGAAFYAALFATFSILPLLAVMIAYTVLAPAGGPRAPARDPILRWAAPRLQTWALFGLGALLAAVPLRALLDYDVLHRYAKAMAAHAAWRPVTWDLPNSIHYGGLTLLEFSLWTGPPLMLLFLARAVRAARRIHGRRRRRADAFALALLASLLLMAFLGRTVCESGRLWIFMVPPIAVAGSQELIAAGRRRSGALLGLALALQLALTYLTKRHQDFW